MKTRSHKISSLKLVMMLNDDGCLVRRIGANKHKPLTKSAYQLCLSNEMLSESRKDVLSSLFLS